MGLVMSDGSWLNRDEFDPIILRGRDCVVTVESLSRGKVKAPAFTNCEMLGYVAKGSVDAFLIDLEDRPRGRSLPKGSFFRIPPTLIHWFRNTGANSAVLMSVLVPTDRDDWESEKGTPLASAWEDESTFLKMPRSWFADVTRYAVNTDDEMKALKNPPTGLFKTAEEVGDFEISHHLVVPLRTKVVGSNVASIMVAARPGTYHSTPHIHAAEQINIVLKGSNWGFCVGPNNMYDATGHREGFMFRFPKMVPHWAWGQDGSGSSSIEFHVPGLHGDPDFKVGLVSMETSDDSLNPSMDKARNIFLDSNSVPVAEIEARSV